MQPQDSQVFDSFVPVYDVVPESWEEGRQFLVEILKKISNAINIREIGWFLDEELLSGKQLYPGTSSSNDQQFRSILRIVVGPQPLAAITNTIPHGIVVDANFTLVDLWASATNSSTFRSTTFSNETNIYMDASNVYITSANAYDRSNIFIEYVQEK